MIERGIFVTRLEKGERMADLCKEFGISRKTGYKFLERYKRCGEIGLSNQSRRPERFAHSISQEIEDLIVAMRWEHPTWGAPKIREILHQRHPGVRLPVRSTIHEILDRHGLVKHRKRHRFPANPTTLRQTNEPNDLWCADYKGQFRLGNRSYCYPLTITDHFSRFIIACEALEDTTSINAIPVFENAFKEYGLPTAIRTDNGAPFSTRGLLGLSKLSVWWLKLGIEVERITPGQPQQNGRHERMHLTLKQETTRPPGANTLQQQERFDLFTDVFNTQRPHEALDMAFPAARYKKSARKYPSSLPDPDYPLHEITCYVNRSGKVYVPGNGDFNLSTILSGELVGLRQEEEKLWRVTFVNFDLGFYDAAEGIFEPIGGKVR
jgi:putative transposase